MTLIATSRFRCRSKAGTRPHAAFSDFVLNLKMGDGRRHPWNQTYIRESIVNVRI